MQNCPISKLNRTIQALIGVDWVENVKRNSAKMNTPD